MVTGSLSASCFFFSMCIESSLLTYNIYKAIANVHDEEKHKIDTIINLLSWSAEMGLLMVDYSVKKLCYSE